MKRREFMSMVGGAVASSAALARAARQPTNEFDVIVVGAGSGGCVVAGRLSLDPSLRVLLIEAGGPNAHEPSITTPGRWVSLIGSPFDWDYQTEPEPGLGGRRVRWPRGKTFGGSSAINAMAYVRGHRASFDAWAEAGGPRWSYREVLPVFRQLEDNSRGASEFHGAGGPLAVSDTTDPHDGHVAFLDAARQSGYAASPTWDFNGAQQENGAGFYQKNVRGGRRHSAAEAFLVPAQSRPNLTIWPRARALRLVIEKGRATGVEVRRDGQRVVAHSRREIVLAAGVIDTPKLLMLSGIGPAGALKAHKIAVAVDLREVGANLHDHSRVSLRWRATRPLRPSSVSAGLFVHSRQLASRAAGGQREVAASQPPDLQFYIGRGTDVVDEFITLTVALSVPRSRGSVTLSSSDPEAPPIIRAGYFADPADLEAMSEGVRFARALAATRAYEGLRGAPVDPAVELRTADDIRTFIRGSADTIFHPVGTCRMGSDAASVVDPTLRVRGVEGLRIADGSVMPVTVNSQTHAACLLIGARAAEFILGG